MEKKHALSFALSQEELFVVLAYLKQPAMMGLNASSLSKLSEEQKHIVLDVAERALIARSMLVVDGKDHLKLSDPVFALVAGCVASDAAVVISYEFPKRPPEAFFFHVSRKLNIVHTIPMSAIHQFIAVEDRKALLRSAMAALSPLGTQKTLSVPGGELTEDLIAQAKEAASNEKTRNSVAGLIEKGGISKETAEEFAKTIIAPTLSATVVRLDFTDKSGKNNDGFTAVAGENGLWMLKPLNPGDEKEKRVSLKPATREQLESLLVGLFQGMPETVK